MESFNPTEFEDPCFGIIWVIYNSENNMKAMRAKHDGDRVREKERGKEGGREQQVPSRRQSGRGAGRGRELHAHCFCAKNQRCSWISVRLRAALLHPFAVIYCPGSLFSVFTRDTSEGSSAPSEQLSDWSPGPGPHRSGGRDLQRSLCLKRLLHFSAGKIKDP